MKKIILLLIALVGYMSINAQSLQLYKDGVVIKEYSKAEVDSIVFKEAPVHEYVDLGLPSGTLWATCNVGANSPEEYGLYFAWGETTGYTSNTSDGRSFDWASYKWCNGSYDTQTKYCAKDNKTIIDSEDDAATANWGIDWCMPTHAQQQELIDERYTTTTWTTQNEVHGLLIISKTNGNSIFLPAAGNREDSDCYPGDGGCYWSSELKSNDLTFAYFLWFSSSDASANNIYCHVYGHSVRAVQSSTR